MPTVLLQDSASEPVTLQEFKAHSVIEFPDYDDYISSILKVSRAVIESESGLVFVEQKWRESYSKFGDFLELSKAPILGVDSIEYVDKGGNVQTLGDGDYRLDYDSRPSKIYPAFGVSWPATRAQHDAVNVIYNAGFGGPDELEKIPPIAKQAIMIEAAHLYQNREPVAPVQLAPIPRTVDHLVSLIKVYGL